MNYCLKRNRAILLLSARFLAICLSPGVMAQGWSCGDVDASQAVDIADLSYLVDYLFFNGAAPTPSLCRGDWNYDATVDISDLNAAIDYLFFLGAAPPVHCCDNCPFGYANCDGNDRNGCEVLINTNPTCASASALSPIYGDASCNPSVSEIYAVGERFMRVRVIDCPDACNPFVPEKLGVNFTLTVPSNVDYDLYVYDDNCSQLAYSAHGTGASESVTIRWDGSCLFGDDSRYFVVEVRLWTGSQSSCGFWHLTVSKSPAPAAMQTPIDEEGL
jgi:hypothetical protein